MTRILVDRFSTWMLPFRSCKVNFAQLNPEEFKLELKAGYINALNDQRTANIIEALLGEPVEVGVRPVILTRANVFLLCSVAPHARIVSSMDEAYVRLLAREGKVAFWKIWLEE
ncbi:MAG TPA: hypothetical protein ENF81_06035 [Thermotogaceae bacterium]|nr:hypothetical protein [Thermotogaceae bacterium]